MDKNHNLGDKNAKTPKIKIYTINERFYTICFSANSLYKICILRKISGVRW